MNTTLKLVRGETLSFIRTMTYCAMTAAALTFVSPVNAGDKTLDNKALDNKSINADLAPASEHNWAVELSSGVLFSNVRTNDSHNGYTMVPVQLGAVYKIDDVSLDDFAGGVFRGNTEFLFRGDFYQEVYGQENHLGGLSVGPRYNFVQPGWKIVPFVEGTVGILFADSNPTSVDGQYSRGLGQDFNFTFGVAAGFRYDLSENWYLRLSANYVHVSNAGLSEPEHDNKPIDALGPQLGIGYRF
jgi:lipid A 3-O-deacylase